MKRLPFGLRLVAGITVTAAEQARALPGKLLGLPISVLSEALQMSMRLQQQMTELAIRGDGALSALRPVEQAPPWATFDEDLLDSAPEEEFAGAELAELRADLRALDQRGPSALSAWETVGNELADSEDPWLAEQRAIAAQHQPGEFDTAETDVEEPALPRAFPNYPELSIPQLRARLRRFSVEDLQELLDYERATTNREEYVHMLSHRIDTVRAEQ